MSFLAGLTFYIFFTIINTYTSLIAWFFIGYWINTGGDFYLCLFFCISSQGAEIGNAVFRV